MKLIDSSLLLIEIISQYTTLFSQFYRNRLKFSEIEKFNTLGAIYNCLWKRRVKVIIQD